MMKFSKTLLLVLGCVAGLAFIGVMIYVVIQLNQLHAVAIANRSAGFVNPRNWTLIGAGLGLLAGLLLGMGVAMPDRSFKVRYAEVRKAEQVLDAQSRGFTGATATTSTDQHVSDPKTAPAAGSERPADPAESEPR